MAARWARESRTGAAAKSHEDVWVVVDPADYDGVIRALDTGDDGADQVLRRRLAAKVSRLLKRLHVRRLIARIPHTRRWRVTQLGGQLLGAIVRLHYHGLSKAA